MRITQRHMENTPPTTTLHNTRHNTTQHNTYTPHNTTQHNNNTTQHHTTPHHTTPHHTTPHHNTHHAPRTTHHAPRTTHHAPHTTHHTHTHTHSHTFTPHTPHKVQTHSFSRCEVRCLLCSHQFCIFMWTASMAEHAGAAMRRRQRRLRQWLRHERLSVAMALAETNHHAAPRGQTKARGRGRGTSCTTRPRSGSASPPGFPATLSGCAPGATCTGTAAHRAAGRRRCPSGPSSRRSCAANGGLSAGVLPCS